MLKRLAISVLLPLYLITASGFAISMHYCGKLLTGVEINAPAKPCVKLSKLKCCTDKEISIKIKDSHQSAAFAFKAQNVSFQIPSPSYTVVFAMPVNGISKIYLNKAPPDIVYHSVPVFIKNCTFLI